MAKFQTESLGVAYCSFDVRALSREDSNMTTVREPRLEPVAILDLRPTQITVGMREVKAKRKHWRDETERKVKSFSANT